MRVSIATIQQYIDFKLPPTSEFIERVNGQLGGIEGTANIAKKYQDPIIIKIIEAVKHPNADRLRVCTIDDGGVVSGVSRNDDGYVQVVCGAPNARAGIFAVWLPPHSTVPASFGDDEPFVLTTRELRGILSQGMLAAADELDLGSDHTGIVEVDSADKQAHVAVKPGVRLADAYGLNDVAIDIENKMFTHRPDCFGQIGIAREIAGILEKPFISPSWYHDIPSFEAPTKASRSSIEVYTDAPSEKVPRLMSVVIDGVRIAPSPLWLRCELIRLGGKPVNNVVDVTNYVMLMTAQPTHAYDYATLRGHRLGARMARDGEAITLLNGKSYQLTADDIVMADGTGAVGLAGIMGGSESEVSINTTSIALEVATFDMYTLRKSSMRHGVFTDALTRFNKGQSPLQNDRVLAYLIRMITDVAGGTIASEVVDLRPGVTEAAYQGQTLSGQLLVSPSFINSRLGSALSDTDITSLLQHVECDVQSRGDKLAITAPFWRTDIELPEDIVEEVGRLRGFDMLPRTLPQRRAEPVTTNASRDCKQLIRESLSRSGSNEVLTYSFVHRHVIEHARQAPAMAYQISNALSPDLQYFRLSLLPSLLDKVHTNSKLGYDEFTLFEIGKSHQKGLVDDDQLPVETGEVAAVYTRKRPGVGAPFYYMRHLVDRLAHDLGVVVGYEPATDDNMKAYRQLIAPFVLSRSAVVMSQHGDIIGIIGEVAPEVRRAFKLPEYTAAMNLFTGVLQKVSVTPHRHYVPLSRFPSIRQDISLRTNTRIPYAQINQMVQEALEASLSDRMKVVVSPVSIYQPENDSTVKTTTLHIEITHYDRTLTDKDVAPLVDGIVRKVLTIGAERV